MIPLFEKHTVRKGESMIGIMKRHSLDPKDWKTVYQRNYRLATKYRNAKPGHIEPGDEVLLPTMSRATFKTIEDGLIWVEDRMTELLDTYGALRAEYARLSRDKSRAVEAYDKAKARLEKLTRTLTAVNGECRKAGQKTGKEPKLGAVSKCLIDAAPDSAFTNELKHLHRTYKTTLADKQAATKAFKRLDDWLNRREALLRSAQKTLSDARNYFVSLQYRMYG